ncbi:hypothetical protein EDF88_3907 [Buttiauxella sp. BIGb0552]|uniref:hypothetical protein n=1 Tax=Buttiauxella sp. BIGb0552 TaxID=2485120 RepID=UPI0010664AF4|nr:hypothetical protein [Buttiauxella sp. BIGb0552]TDX14590.1 hypothetical protein EDF88_3907 [Buttiauxella sp. BIGb0552]
MTTNRMGLEQTLSDDNLKDLSAFLMESYTGSLDTLRYAYAAEAINELLACRKASKDPAYFINKVTYGDDVELRIYCYELDAMKSKDDFGGVVIPLYAAPPLQAVTVPDEVTFEQARLMAYGLTPAEAFQKAWSHLRGIILKSATNEP